MNLTSCDNCGVVLDKDKLVFHDPYDTDTGMVDTSRAVWDGENFIAKIPCPVCKADILASGGDL